MEAVTGPVEIPFAEGKSGLTRAAKAAADKLADMLVTYPLYGAVLTAGAAPAEKSPARLADRRAAAVTRYLTGRGGVAAEQLMVVVKRSERPDVSILVVERPIPPFDPA